MEKRDLFGFSVEVDADSTRDWYAEAEDWGCTCVSCRNFLVLAWKRMLPGPALDTLDSLGISPEKATYVCELTHDESGHCYEFSYRIAGNILSGDEMASVSLGWGSVLCFHEPYPYGAPHFPKPHFDLDFSITLPWVLDEPE